MDQVSRIGLVSVARWRMNDRCDWKGEVDLEPFMSCHSGYISSFLLDLDVLTGSIIYFLIFQRFLSHSWRKFSVLTEINSWKTLLIAESCISHFPFDVLICLIHTEILACCPPQGRSLSFGGIGASAWILILLLGLDLKLFQPIPLNSPPRFLVYIQI